MMHICILFCDVIIFEISSRPLSLSLTNSWRYSKTIMTALLSHLKWLLQISYSLRVIISFSWDNAEILRNATDMCVSSMMRVFDCVHRKKEISCLKNIFHFNKISRKLWNDKVFSKQKKIFFLHNTNNRHNNIDNAVFQNSQFESGVLSIGA